MAEVTAVITQESAKISCNFEQVEKALQDKLSEYKGAVFTEDSKPMAKKTVASLRADKKNFSDNLREEKKKYMKPWDDFEAQAKRLISMYDEPIDFINGQVQAFEENRIAKKRELISQIYEELVPADLSGYIPLKRIYNQKWENATTKEKDIRNEISSAAEKVQKDIATISAMESASESNALLAYRTNLDITEAVSHINAYERQKQEILAREQERIRREEEERVRREERERMLAEQRAREEKEAAIRQAEMERQEALRRAEVEKAEALRRAELVRQEEARRAEEEKAAAVEQARAEAAQEAIDNLIPDMENEEETFFCNCNVIVTKKQKEALELYMSSVGIEWEWV
ncbi:DUF1351 domain-containing protein [uncultured Acetatifactor sp.]|uniref:DUF1351 domain-containing protein n=1 Tax=uncultured Acetatifactor sp. TaxID=1671927 RepID=UPI002626DFE7|nr:DUF1351 domain-containing protein [uncultured Acetatifactor sp.]